MTFEQKLQRFAEVAIKIGLNLQAGQDLVLRANIEHLTLVRKLVKEAYKVGAKNVVVMYNDDENTLAFFEHGSKQALESAPQWLIDGLVKAIQGNAASLSITGGNPSLLKHVDPEKISIVNKTQGAASQKIGELIAGFAINWSAISFASPAWAKEVFPTLNETDAVAKLWEAIFDISRASDTDPVAAWQSHLDNLRNKKDMLNNKRYKALYFRGPGTDLEIGLIENHLWVGGSATAQNGVTCVPNIPTEEVFTMPHTGRVQGYVSSTKPLSVFGNIIEEMYVRFEAGVIVEAKAKKGQEVLEKLLETDAGAKRLGEVALVPHSSPVSRSGILFYNTLFDENAACHIALGKCYGENLGNYNDLSESERQAAGANDSLIHEDWMIGSDKVDVDGVQENGASEALMRSGEWVL
jgi:aminopeptidase